MTDTPVTTDPAADELAEIQTYVEYCVIVHLKTRAVQQKQYEVAVWLRDQQPKVGDQEARQALPDLLSALTEARQKIKHLEAESAVAHDRMLVYEEENERLRAERRWVPVAERLPSAGVEVPFLFENHEGQLVEGYGHKVVADPDDPRWEDVLWMDSYSDPHEVITVRYWYELPPPPVVDGGERGDKEARDSK